MKTENLSTLKIHKLTQAQYDRELEAGRIDLNALYLTPDEAVDNTIDIVGTANNAVSEHNNSASSHSDMRSSISGLTNQVNGFVNSFSTMSDQIEQLNEGKANKSGLTLGVHTDGLVYLFIDGVPHGNGLDIQASVVEGDVFGYVDENNVVVLNGALADGTYTIKYEMQNGSTINIGNLVLDSNVYHSITKNLTNCTISNSATQVIEGESYVATIAANSGYELKSVTVTMGGNPVTVSGGTISIASVTGNIVITAVAEETAVEPEYTNILTSGDYEIQLNKRWSASSKAYSTCNGMIAFKIPIADVLNKTIRFKGFPVNTSAGSNAPIWMTLDSSDNRISNLTDTSDGTGNIWKCSKLISNAGVYSIQVSSETFTNNVGTATVLAINMAANAGTAITTLPDTLIMTIGEEIV